PERCATLTDADTLSLHDALPILLHGADERFLPALFPGDHRLEIAQVGAGADLVDRGADPLRQGMGAGRVGDVEVGEVDRDGDSLDRKSTRLNSSHVKTSYAVSCL